MCATKSPVDCTDPKFFRILRDQATTVSLSHLQDALDKSLTGYWPTCKSNFVLDGQYLFVNGYQSIHPFVLKYHCY